MGISLKEAIFTAPAHPFWGGAGLIGQDGKLLGVGSLHVEQATEEGQQRDINMIVPIDLLPPILDDLLAYGRVNKAPRPWLGVYSAEGEGRVVIVDVAERGPAAAAGMRRGDVVTAVRDSSVESLGDFYRKVWSCGPAGAEIPIEVVATGATCGCASSLPIAAVISRSRGCTESAPSPEMRASPGAARTDWATV